MGRGLSIKKGNSLLLPYLMHGWLATSLVLRDGTGGVFYVYGFVQSRVRLLPGLATLLNIFSVWFLNFPIGVGMAIFRSSQPLPHPQPLKGFLSRSFKGPQPKHTFYTDTKL